MKKIVLLCLFLLSALVPETMAQSRAITGKVTDATSGQPLPGVTVLVKGTTVGTATSADGTYTLNAPQGNNTLVFSFIGYQTIERAIGANNTVNVALPINTQQLSEVVVTALGIQREEKSIGYAAQKVSGDELSQVRETNVVNSLSGRVAGVQVGNNSGAMGGSAKVTMRGVSSINGDNNALFVVDGVPIANSNTNSVNQQRGGGGYDYGSAIQDINPNDVAEVTVLKGAAATALYGSRGANGVIVITTKKGSKKDGIGVNYTLGYTMDRVYKLPDYQDKYGGGFGFTKLYYDALTPEERAKAFPDGRQGTYNDNDGKGSYDLVPNYNVDESWGPKYEGQLYRPYWSWDKDSGNPDFGALAKWEAQPDNIRGFFETGTTLTNTVAFDGANDKGAFRLSYSNLNQDFILPNSELERHNLGFTGSLNLSEKLSVSTNINYVTHEAVGRPGTGYDGNNLMLQFTQWGQRQLDIDRAKNYMLPDGTQLTWNRTAWDNPKPKYTDNPYWIRYMSFQNDGRNRIFGNVSANYKLTDNITIDVRSSTDTYSETQEERIAIGSQSIPSYSLNKINFMENNLQGVINFNKDLSESFSLNAFVGANRMKQNRATMFGTTVDGLSSSVYNLSASVGNPRIIEEKFEKQINSVFGSASFGFKDILFLDVTARNDWSSTLPADANSYFYPAVSASYIFTDLIGASWLNMAKLRAGIAKVGNDTDPYNTLLSYNLNQPFDSYSRVSVPNTLPNNELKPEITTEYEVGTELRAFDDRLGLNFSYYNRQTENQILAISRSAATGHTRKWINAGLIENKGVELNVYGTPIRTNDFSWDVNVNWAKNENKIVELTDDQKTIVLVNAPFAVRLEAREGESFGSIVGYDYVYDDNGNKVVGANGYYLRSSEQKVIGSVLPDFTGGVTNTFRYKGVSLSALVDFQKGGDFFSTTQMWGKYSGILEETAAGDIRENGMVTPGVLADGSENTKVVSAGNYFFYNAGYRIGAADIVDASYIYLREMSLGYSLPGTLVKKTPFSNVKLSFVGRNLWLISSNSEHIDPSNITNSITNIQGIEGGALPSVRSYGFTLSLGL
ncbi:SusC/RagA family TonB-linked outer membrane protein [Pontibacter cellulosilyticus]|uniref:SusC/RagA family TonB-linked outer membrane protein n=1 Tax=Pontibacter cellulosilyticus TaxID=1720253 RepID=A0A923N9P8_9BACT|nr:SusC/RagA family TonB-linked outer membrane protein [Pontibacter cellulosilyticus]MBC5994788.1 SusC/RagA family TonB-linked outer membrane protein [Pontibacter cellulosilyticus]